MEYCHRLRKKKLKQNKKKKYIYSIAKTKSCSHGDLGDNLKRKDILYNKDKKKYFLLKFCLESE